MNTTSRHNLTLHHATTQSGSTLLIVLILLIVITLLGISSIRGSALQERMVGGAIAQNLAFQAAEAGLRQAEAELVAAAPTLPKPGEPCKDGYCPRHAASDDPEWLAASFWTSGNGFKTGEEIGTGVGKTRPRYVIEDFGKGENSSSSATDLAGAHPPLADPPPQLYRITAVAGVRNSEVEAMLQSIFRR